MSSADDKESVDRAFAELVAGFHLTADRPEPSGSSAAGVDRDPPPSAWEPPVADRPVAAPGSVFEPPRPLSPAELPPDLIDDRGPDEGYDPGPPPPLPKPAWPVLVGWIGIGYAVLTVFAVAIGITLPSWAGWAGILGFAGGFGVLISRLPRQRPPDAGDGAVL